MNNNRLKIGDSVNWNGSWGAASTEKAKIENIEICAKGCKSGKEVKSILWNTITSGKRQVIVTLDNGHWAYGYQISLVK